MILAIRSLRKTPAMSVTVILLLGFGIGANTALFSLFRAILTRPIPGVRDSDAIMRLRRTQNGRAQGNQSYPDYLDFRDQSKTITDLVAERLVPLRMGGRPAQVVNGAIVTTNYFQALGVRPVSGRLFGRDDDQATSNQVVLSEAFWRRQLGGEHQAVGATLILNGYPFTIAGVAAAPFVGVELAERTEVWMPITMVKQAMPRNAGYPFLLDRRAGWLTWYGRLRPGVTIAQAAREWDGIAEQLEKLYPQSNRGRRFEVNPHASMSPERRAELSRLLGLLFSSVCLVLLIACGNAASLLLTRSVARAREMAIRMALGASRGALLRQLLAESLLLVSGGAAVGLMLAPWMINILATIWRQSVESIFVLDWGLLGFAVLISVLCVLVCGLAPAWSASSTNVAAALKDASQGSGRKRVRMQSAFVVAQIALSVALLAVSSLVLGSMRRILGIQPGYQVRGMVVATMDLSLLGYSHEAGTQFFQDLMRHVSAIPGVRSATLGKSSPAVDWSDRVNIFRPHEAPAEGMREEQAPNAIRTDRNVVAPGYFATLRIPLLAGRDFTTADRQGTTPVAIVSRALANRLWGGQNAIGRQILMPVDGQTPAAMPLEVIGVAADSRYRSVLDDPTMLLYIPLLQNYDSIARLMVAVDGPAADFKEPVRRAIQQFNPDLPLRAVSTMEEQIEQSVWERRAAASVLSLFGALALGLAWTGIHGLVAYATAQKTREIAIRMALGSGRTKVLGQIARNAIRLALTGIAIGIPLAAWVKPAIASFLYRAEGMTATAFSAVALLFVGVALLSSALPARRAASIDPVSVLRQE
jgi:putative ABC transport system permease protein